MIRFWGHALSATALAAVSATAIPSCSNDNSTLFVQNVLYPPQASAGVCTYTDSPTAPFLARGTVDAALANSYTPWFLIASQMLSTANPATVRTESSIINIQGATVRVVDPVDGSVWMDATVLTAGSVNPASGTTPTYLPIPATIMDAHAIAHFDPAPGSTKVSLVSNLAEVFVTFYGQTLGGQSITGQEFQYPVDVCHGCLVSFPALSNVGTVTAPSPLALYCSGATASTSVVQPPCVTGQDQPVDCQLCYVNPISTICHP